MEIQILTPTNAQPLPKVEWNYAELKAWLSDGLKRYEGIVYDDTQIGLAKKDRANLNKLAEAIDAKRKEMKALYLEPYAEFEAQAKELTGMVKAQADAIAAQIKAFDDFRKQQKREKIVKLFEQIFGNLAKLVPFERIENPKWYNVTTTEAAVSEEIASLAERIEKGLAAIDKMGAPEQVTCHLVTSFLHKFDLSEVFAEKERYERQRAELARLNAERLARVAEQPTPPIQTAPVMHEVPAQPTEQPTAEPVADPAPLHTVVFKVEATEIQLAALKAFLKANNIKYGRP